MTTRWIRGVLRAAPGQAASRTVIKVGGSLLLRPEWPAELLTVVAAGPGPTTVVVGGGPVVDGLRAIDAACPGPVETMHRLAIDAMGITARLAAEATGLRLASAPAEGADTVLLDAAAWLAAAGRLAALPVGWNVTSDSIAAVVAADCGAGLVLMKSVPPPVGGDDLAALAGHGWIDDHFPAAAASLSQIGWIAPAAVSPTSSR